MNAASAPLGTLLVQRLDAMLGATLSQQSNLAAGAHPDAVSQPARTDRSDRADNWAQRHPQDTVNRATSRVATYQAAMAHQDAARSPPGGTSPCAQLRLGATARLILALLAQYPQRMPVRMRTPLLQVSNANLAVTPNLLATRLQHALMQVVQDSGMFYESHLAQLVQGRRSAASLRGEPQANVKSANVASSARGVQARVSPDVAPETQSLLRQQLEVLAQQSFAWQGQAWAGADMDWEIHRLPSESADHPDDPDPSEASEPWSSTLTLQLSALGRIQARLTLTGSAVAIDLTAPDGALQLQQHADALRQRLSAAGLALCRLSIAARATDTAPDAAVARAAQPGSSSANAS